MAEFKWDAGKAASNLFKHGVSFAEAMTVLSDALEVMIPDPAHSDAELRFVSIGVSEAGRLLIVAYTERDQRIRIISARQATSRERRQMSQNVNPEDMLPEYDFSHGVRGKHHEAYKAGTNVVFLDPDLAKVFKDSDSVNRVLRLLLNLANENVAPNRPT